MKSLQSSASPSPAVYFGPSAAGPWRLWRRSRSHQKRCRCLWGWQRALGWERVSLCWQGTWGLSVSLHGCLLCWSWPWLLDHPWLLFVSVTVCWARPSACWWLRRPWWQLSPGNSLSRASGRCWWPLLQLLWSHVVPCHAWWRTQGQRLCSWLQLWARAWPCGGCLQGLWMAVLLLPWAGLQLPAAAPLSAQSLRGSWVLFEEGLCWQNELWCFGGARNDKGKVAEQK